MEKTRNGLKEIIPISSDDIVSWFSDELDDINKTIFECGYSATFENLYLFDDVLSQIRNNGYYLMVEPTYFINGCKKANKKEISDYLCTYKDNTDVLLMSNKTDYKASSKFKKLLK